MLDLLVGGNQMGAAYEITGFMMALYVVRMVSLSWPQVVPVRAFSTCRRLDALAAMLVTCGVKVNRGSNITPRILGFLLVGTGVLLMVTDGSAFT